jgi:hypothetical protein
MHWTPSSGRRMQFVWAAPKNCGASLGWAGEDTCPYVGIAAGQPRAAVPTGSRVKMNG